MKIRSGGLKELEQRVIDGDVKALRALVRQASGPNTLDLAFRDVQLRAKPDGTGGERLLFTGYACVVDAPFTMFDWYGAYEEVVRPGAFTKTLSESPDVVFCLNHDWNAAPMARTTAGTHRLSEDTVGLGVEADIDGSRADVHQVQSAMDGGELNAMSFAFYVVRQTWSPDYEQRDIIEVDLDGGDTSVVTHPANPATTGTTDLRKRAASALARSRVPALIAERARVERRDGEVSEPTAAALREVFSLLGDYTTSDFADTVISTFLEGTTEKPDDESHSVAGPVPEVRRERLRLMALAGK